jgi:hypothetical protein
MDTVDSGPIRFVVSSNSYQLFVFNKDMDMSYNLTHFLLSKGIPELEAMDLEPKYTFHAVDGN